MTLFDRFRNRPLQASTTQRKVRDQPGPMTAHEAWAIVRPVAHELDPRARLTFITSGLDMSREGRSFTWEFLFHLPGGRARALLTLEPNRETGDIDNAPIILVQRLTPASVAGLDRATVLPERFRDSPEVVAEFAAGGVDFVAGPTDMKLEGRVLDTGEAVWVTYYWDGERKASFTAVTQPR